MNIFDRIVHNRAKKLVQAAAEKKRRDFDDMLLGDRREKDEDEDTFTNEQSLNNTFTLHKCINGHLLEVWEANPGGGASAHPALRPSGPRTQRLYIIPEGEDVIGAVASALVANRLEK